jgi:hypothetical protein
MVLLKVKPARHKMAWLLLSERYGVSTYSFGLVTPLDPLNGDIYYGDANLFPGFVTIILGH